MKPDTIELFNGHTIQHGKFNDRIYLMKFSSEDSDNISEKLIELATKKQYSKIFAKMPDCYSDDFLAAGFELEATIPGFYNGRQDACLLGYYLDKTRRQPATAKANEEVIELCHRKQKQDNPTAKLPDSMLLRRCRLNDAFEMAKLYKEVFASYPFPIDDPEYIKQTMKSHVDYFGIWQDGRLIALSSAEKDIELKNAEMTDFATLPEARGASLAMILLANMEQEMRLQGIITAYTIARAASFGMNLTFAKQGYAFTGRLLQNTQIGGQFEDMNVWHKKIS